MSLWSNIYSRRSQLTINNEPWFERREVYDRTERCVHYDDPDAELRDDFADRDITPEDSHRETSRPTEAFADEEGDQYLTETSIKEIGDANEQEAVREFEDSGFEALAWYAPITFFGPSRWGIYFHQSRFFGFCRYLQRQLQTPRLLEVVCDVYKMLNRHESFHAATELFALISQDQSNSYGSHFGADLYPEYFRKHYQSTWGTSRCLEEALATRAQFNRMRFRARGLRQLLEHLTKHSLGGYRDFQKYHSDRAYRVGLFELSAEKIISGTPNGARHINSLLHLSQFQQSQLANGWWFPSVKPSDLDRLGPIPRYATQQRGQYTRLFAPAPLGNYRVADFAKAVQKKYAAVLTTGHKSHPKHLRFPNNVVVPLPQCREVPHYLIREIANAVKKDKKEVLRDLGRV